MSTGTRGFFTGTGPRFSVMAFVRERPRKDGTTAFVVQWVEPATGKQTTRTMATRRDADGLADLLTANGNSFALAAQTATRRRCDPARPSRQQLARHLEHHETGAHDRVFPSVHGEQLPIRELHSAWGAALVGLGDHPRARPRIHERPHTHAFWLIVVRVPLVMVQRRLRQEASQTTSD